MIEIEKPKIETIEISDDAKYGKFIVEPLERGYGTTLGNSLRRILLSSLPGAAVTAIQIDGVLHEFSTIEGVVEDVTSIILNINRLGLGDCLMPVEISPGMELSFELRALQDDAPLRLRLDHLDRCVEQRLVGDERRRLDAARSGDDDLRPRVLDSTRELVCGETAEHDRVDRADAGAGQHRDDGLRHHRHVDDDAVALLHALSREYAGEPRHLVAQLAVGEARRGSRDGRVVDERHCSPRPPSTCRSSAL